MKNPQIWFWMGLIQFLVEQGNSFMLIKYKKVGLGLMHIQVS